MDALIRLTGWRMKLVPSYGTFHLSFVAIGALIIFVLTSRLKHISNRKSDWFIFSMGIFLLSTEIYKQLFYYYVVTPYEYSWWIFPFQMCSIPMYGSLAIHFIKNEKLKNTVLDYMASFGLFGGFISFLEPSGLIHEYWTLTLHAFVWHLLLVLIAVHIFRTRKHSFTSFANTVKLFLVLLGVALTINFSVITLLNQEINMFFAGPEISPIIVFTEISTKVGWFINDLIFFSLLIGATGLFRKLILKKMKLT